MLPPFTDMRSVQTLVDGDQLTIGYGAQDVSAHDSGAYTGEISAAMLAKLGCTYVVVGHSERREYHARGRRDRSTPRRKAASRHGLTPIVCVGEGLEVRQAGEPRRAHARPARRLARRLHRRAGRAALVVAYEPVWAIGTGEVATPEDAQEVCAAIRARLARACYGGRGGRRRPDPLRRLGQGRQRRRDHGQGRRRRRLVGGASLRADEFGGICRFYDTSACAPDVRPAGDRRQASAFPRPVRRCSVTLHRRCDLTSQRDDRPADRLVSTCS